MTAPAQPTDGTAHSSLTSSLFTPGKAATNGEYAASYNNTPVNITVTAPSAPANGTEVAGETDSSKFVAGTAAVTGNNGTAGVWTVKYATTAIPSLEVTVQNTGTTLGTAPSDQTAPTGFNSSTYSEGKAHEAEVIPSPSAIDIDRLNKGDTVTIGSDTYKVEEAISYPSIKGPYYATGTANSFVTDVTKADGYTSQKNPSPETFATDGTVPTLIINGIKYTWVQSDAPLEFTTDSVEIYI